ncbi:MAG TPA: KUP/HAK/KT family potassium transporter [Flavobacteriales bacterium]|nr:KUP/HAK/KT family potassium transporter [Flavobacteriales bacterium]
MALSKNGTKAKITAASLLVALGIIYGDIGTSPLYVLKAVVGDRPIDEMLVYGGISCVFWTITFQTTFKYIFLTLKADNNGEGGIFSLYALVRRYGKYLILPTILGASTLLADGIITPPISVASAVEGLTNLNGLEHIKTVPIVIGVICILFFFQMYGTHKVGTAFGPAMFFWFTMLLTLGLVQVIQNPAILKAVNPIYAYDFLTKYPQGFILLGAVFLATTGAEALYSDLGHCGRRNVRLTWGFVKTCLLLNYMGQGAWLLSHKGETLVQYVGKTKTILNPFYEIMPHWFLIPGIIISTMAAIIASQALISGSYTLINEAMNLNFWPRVAVRQPSEVKGQIYIPSVNIILWIGCVLMVLYFQNSSNMEAAYGLAITLTMMVTTYLLSFFLLFKLKWNKILVYSLVLLFASIEISFFIANIHKFPEGGYITLLISSVFFFIMYSVYKGRKTSNRFTKFVDLGKYVADIKELSEDDEIPKTSTHLIYLTKANKRHEIEEKIMKSIFSKHPKRADIYWFVHIHRTPDPYNLTYTVTELVEDKVIKVNINIGFRVQPRTELFFKKIVQELINNRELNLHLRPDVATKYNDEPDFKFVVIEKFLSVENEFTLRDGILLKTYFLLKRQGLSDEEAFGLDKSDVIVEHVPLVYQPASKIELRREGNNNSI